MQQTFKAGDLPIASVTVFKDRAEVTRILEAKLEAGQNEIVVEELTSSVSQDTICVDSKDVQIQEVQYRCKYLKEDEFPTKLKELYEKLEDLKRQRQRIVGERDAVTRHVDALERMAKQNPPNIKDREIGKDVATAIPYDAGDLEKVAKFFNLYEKQSKELSARVCAFNEIIQELTKQEEALNEIPTSQRRTWRVMKVLVECEKPCSAVMEIRYQVFGATWRPSYDIKVKTDKDGAEQLKVVYQGIITQTTGEDWTNTKVILSTADPGNATQLEQLGTLNIACRNTQKRKGKGRGVPGPSGGASLYKVVSNEPWASQTGGPGQTTERADEQQGVVEEEAGEPEAPEGQRSFAAVFTIDRKTSVPSESGDHKVAITTLEVKPKIIHKTVPRKNCNVYITALTSNETPFPFLEGIAAVYYNNSFVSNSKMNRVDPGEKFSCNLGVDPSVVVEYRPYHQTSSEIGPITKIARITHDQTTVVHNKKQHEKVLLIVQEHLPKSSEERVQVTLNSPKVVEANKPGEMTPGARINAANNLEWTLLLEPGEKNELFVSYNVDHPIGEEIRFFTTT